MAEQQLFLPKTGDKANIYGLFLTPTLSEEPCEYVAADGTFQIVDPTKRIIDINTAVTVVAKDNGDEVDVFLDTGYARDGVHNLNGKVKIYISPEEEDPPELDALTVTISGKYITTQRIGEARTWAINPDRALIDTGRFGSEAREYVKGIKAWSGTFGSFLIDPFWVQKYDADEPVYVKFFVDETSGFHGFCHVPSLNLTSNFEGAAEQTVNFTGQWILLPFPEVDVELYKLTLVADPEAGAEALGGAGFYEEGAIVLVSTVPADTHTFDNWTNPVPEQESDELAFLYTMPDEDITLTANFTLKE